MAASQITSIFVIFVTNWSSGINSRKTWICSFMRSTRRLSRALASLLSLLMPVSFGPLRRVRFLCSRVCVVVVRSVPPGSIVHACTRPGASGWVLELSARVYLSIIKRFVWLLCLWSEPKTKQKPAFCPRATGSLVPARSLNERGIIRKFAFIRRRSSSVFMSVGAEFVGSRAWSRPVLRLL